MSNRMRTLDDVEARRLASMTPKQEVREIVAPKGRGEW
jgi:hypothetical protein